MAILKFNPQNNCDRTFKRQIDRPLPLNKKDKQRSHSKAKIIAFLKFNPQDDSDRTSKNNRTFKVQSDRTFKSQNRTTRSAIAIQWDNLYVLLQNKTRLPCRKKP
jgi:hypothetical protein